MEPLKLSLRVKEIPVILENADGVEEKYTLRELIGKTRDEYLTSIADKMKYDGKGNPSGLKNFDGLQSSLLSRTLFDAESKPVSVEKLDAFPASALTTLFEKSQELSGMDKKAPEKAKKD